MDTKEVLRQLRLYNQTCSKLTCSSLEWEYIHLVNTKEYLYGFPIDYAKHTLHDDVNQFLKEHHSFKGLLHDKNEKLCFTLKQLSNYSCNKRLIRMDARSNNFSYHHNYIYHIIGSFYIFYGLDLDLQKLIYGEYRQFPLNVDFSYIISTELLQNNQDAIQYCKDVLTSENNTAILTRDVIKAIEQSNNQELHNLLIQVFLAAKLQEGLRQSVIETADEFQIEFFYKIIDTVYNNDLLRYSSVQRGILTWTGIGYEVVEEKQIKEIFNYLYELIHHPELISISLNDVNPLHVYLGLYCIGIKNVDKAIEQAIELLHDQPRHIVASALIYLKLTNHFNLLNHLNLISIYQDDEWIKALFASEVIKMQFDKIKLSEDQANILFNFTYSCINNIKPTQSYHSKGFEWFSITLDKHWMIIKCFKIIENKPNKERIETFLPYISSLTNKDTETFMNQHISYISLEKKKAFFVKEIISSNETLSKLITQEYEKIKLNEQDIIELESRLKTKKAYARANIIKVLSKQNKQLVTDSYHRLIQSNTKLIQEAALELKQCTPNYFGVQEKQIEIIGKDKGFGLYTPKNIFTIKYPSHLSFNEKGFFKKQKVLDLNFIQPLKEKQILDYLNLWNERIKEHALDEYEVRGEYRQIGDKNFYPVSYKDNTLDSLPLSELWKEYFKQDHLSANVLFEIIFLLQSIDIAFDNFMESDIKLFSLSSQDVNQLEYYRHIRIIFKHYFEERKNECKTNILQFIEMMCRFTKHQLYNKQNYQGVKVVHSIASLDFFSYLLSKIDCYEVTDEEFKEIFPTLYHAYLKFHIGCREACEGKLNLPLLVISRAVVLGIIPQEVLYEAILDTHTIAQEGSYGHTRKHRLFDAYRDAYYKGRGTYGKPDFSLYGNHEALIHLRKTLDEIVEVLLPMEASRFNEETEVTNYVTNLYVVRGIKHLILALKVLDKEDLKRQNYGNDRNAVFAKLISHCYPSNDDHLDELRKQNFSEKRLVEVAMFAPQWIDTINELLEWDGFKETCYYFIAHMKDYNYDHKKAEIAKFTDLDPLDLNDGAFDMQWCKEIYKKLGDKRFKMIYDASKFLCENSFHTRARKYADAVLNKVDKQTYLQQAKDKRNKDALNAYCICPIKDDQDLLERYIYVQQFLKESKQFGSQRQASEARTCEIALQNLARNSRFETTTRLSWIMETEMVNQYAFLLNPQKVDDIEVYLEIQDGHNEIRVIKNNKKLKSIPDKYKKHETIILIKDIHKKWNDQYRRSKAMLEKAMEDKTIFTFEEIQAIMKNPIISPLLDKLILISNQHFGLYEHGKLKGIHEIYDFDNYIRIAHPYDLYKHQVWHSYQKYIFDNEIVQPFKQVFRELYLKLEDELQYSYTKRYSGYQIQISKATGALKSRKWNLSYENGLEKICYKDDLVVNLYADADWFSPSDIEAPSIDYVGFSSRRTNKNVLIQDIDEITFSECMRDVDMAVSVAYVGGVDPITSFSTIELRKTIAEYTCQLMKLNQVSFSGHFANIKGSINDYSVHLGSGNVHQNGGASIHILPVYSGKRGNVYLPFLDEDPVTAQIISKIILLAEDYKFKDPSILSQISTK